MELHACQTISHYQFYRGTIHMEARRWDEAMRELDKGKSFDVKFGL